MLIGMEDVAVVTVDEIGNRRHHAFLIRTAKQENRRIFHGGVERAGNCRLKNSDCRGKPKHFAIRNLESEMFNFAYPVFFSSFAISRAALAPEPPVRPEPGWVPDPHRYKFAMGVR